MNIQINPKYNHLREFVEKIPDLFDEQGEEIYHSRNVIKVMQAPDGMAVNVKRYHVPRGVNLLIYSLGLRHPKGLRAFTYPDVLLRNDIDTPEPIAYIEERHHGLLGYSYFISVQCDYGHTLYEVGDAPEGTYEELAIQLARYAAAMHEKGILHKDFTPGNILWKRDDDGQYHFSLVDINRMYFGKVSPQMGLRNLTRLWGPRHFSELIFQEYAHNRGLNEEETIEEGLRMRQQFWKKYAKKHNVPFTLEY